MTPEQFAYWLQGFAEINAATPTKEQWESIKQHLQMVFTKVTPTYIHPLDKVQPLQPTFGPAICKSLEGMTYC